MKTYQVQAKYESYTIITIEAETPEEAEALAWQELETDNSYQAYGNWELESINEGEQA